MGMCELNFSTEDVHVYSLFFVCLTTLFLFFLYWVFLMCNCVSDSQGQGKLDSHRQTKWIHSTEFYYRDCQSVGYLVCTLKQ